jgi:hypothetical protein
MSEDSTTIFDNPVMEQIAETVREGARADVDRLKHVTTADIVVLNQRAVSMEWFPRIAPADLALLSHGDGRFVHGHFVHGIYPIAQRGSESIWWYQLGLFLNKPPGYAGDDWIRLRRFYLRGIPEDFERLEDKRDHLRAMNTAKRRCVRSEARRRGA